MGNEPADGRGSVEESFPFIATEWSSKHLLLKQNLSLQLEKEGVSPYERAIRIANEFRSKNTEYATKLGFNIQKRIPAILQEFEQRANQTGGDGLPVRGERIDRGIRSGLGSGAPGIITYLLLNLLLFKWLIL